MGGIEDYLSQSEIIMKRFIDKVLQKVRKIKPAKTVGMVDKRNKAVLRKI